MFLFYKFMFLNMLVFSSILSISSNSWFGMWMGLEIYMLSMITMMNHVNTHCTGSTMMMKMIPNINPNSNIINFISISSNNNSILCIWYLNYFMS